MSDEELMAEFQAGDDSAFERLYERYRRPIYQYVYRRIGNPGRAEELTQEVFLGLVRSRGSWRSEASFKTYVYRIAFNQCASESRRPDFKTVGPLEHSDGTPVDVPARGQAQDKVLARDQEARLVAAAVLALDPDHRDALLLREYQELSYEEIAEVLGVALGTVKSRIFRAKMELKKALEPLLQSGREPGTGKVIPLRSTSR